MRDAATQHTTSTAETETAFSTEEKTEKGLKNHGLHSKGVVAHRRNAPPRRCCSLATALPAPHAREPRYLDLRGETSGTAAHPLELYDTATTSAEPTPHQTHPSAEIADMPRRPCSNAKSMQGESIPPELARRSQRSLALGKGPSEACPAWGEEGAKKPPSLRLAHRSPPAPAVPTKR